MNETEKKALATLSEEEKSEIVGGGIIDEEAELTKEQCAKLKKAITRKRHNHYEPTLFQPVLCKYGGPGMFKPKHPPIIKPISTEKPIEIDQSEKHDEQ